MSLLPDTDRILLEIWRVGLMGASSSPRLVVLLLAAIDSALAIQGRQPLQTR